MFVNGEQFALGDHASNTSSEPPTSGRILAITGCTNSGKTTIAKMLTNMFLDEGATVQIIHQDDFYYTQEKVEKVHRKSGSKPSYFFNYDCKSAVDNKKLINVIKATALSFDYVVVGEQYADRVDRHH